MPTILTHPVVPLSIALTGGERAGIRNRLLLAGIAASVLPDADVTAFWLGIPYEHALGHRGFSHSPLFAVLAAAAGAQWLFPGQRVRAFWFLFLSCLSHGFLDAATNGGLGIGFFIPFHEGRFFLPWRPIEVSPLSVAAFFLGYGNHVLISELKWVWAPCLTAAGLARLSRLYGKTF